MLSMFASADLETFAVDHRDQVRDMLWVTWLFVVPALGIAAGLVLRGGRPRRRMLASAFLGCAALLTVLAVGIPWYLDSITPFLADATR